MSNFEARRQKIVEEVAWETLHQRVENLLLELGHSTDSIPKLMEMFDIAREKLSVMKPVEFSANEITTLLMTIALDQKERIEKLEELLKRG